MYIININNNNNNVCVCVCCDAQLVRASAIPVGYFLLLFLFYDQNKENHIFALSKSILVIPTKLGMDFARGKGHLVHEFDLKRP